MEINWPNSLVRAAFSAGLAISATFSLSIALAQDQSHVRPIGSAVNINSLPNTAPGTATLKPGFNCPPGKTWNQNVAYPACVGAPVISGPRACNAGPVIWFGPTGAQCVSDAPVRDHGQTLPLTAGGAYTGSATALCSNGTWTTTGPTICNPPACAATMLSWTVGSAYCQAAATSASNGGSLTLTSSNANTGTASFMCVNGTWATPTGASCSGPYTPPAPVAPSPGGLTPIPITPPSVPTAPGSCTYGATSGAWDFCAGSTGGGTVSVGTNVTINNTNSGYTGALIYRCEVPSGGGAPSMREISRTCSPGASLKCSYSAFGLSPGSTMGWAVGPTACAGPLPPEPSAGSSITVTSNNGNSGTYTATCMPNGQWNPTPSYTCTSTPTQCPAKDVVWDSSDGSLTCVGRAPATNFGGTVTVDDTVSGNNGRANVTCTSNGTWGTPFNKSCSAPMQPCPGGGSLAWGASCYGSGPAQQMPNGASFATPNLQYGYAGMGNFRCSSGVWVDLGSTCNLDVPAPQPSCSSSAYRYGIVYDYCTRRPQYANPSTWCAADGMCISTPPPPLNSDRAYPQKTADWFSCSTDPRPWHPMTIEMKTEIDAVNHATRAQWCTD